MRHLIHIGFGKAASTLIQRWFAAHPELLYAEGGIAGCRDVYQMGAQVAAGDDSGWRVTSFEGLAMPFTTPYSTGPEEEIWAAILAAQPRACAMLADLFPGAHILIVTRGFKTILLSTYSQYVRAGGGLDLPALLKLVAPIHPWRYDRVIADYRRRFGADRVILLPWELLRDDPDAFFGALSERLGIAALPPGEVRLNVSLSGAELRWYPRIRRWVDRLPLPARLRRAVPRAYHRFAYHNRARRLVRLLQWIRPLEPVTARSMPEDLSPFRGAAAGLADEPSYRAYTDDYLF